MEPDWLRQARANGLIVGEAAVGPLAASPTVRERLGLKESEAEFQQRVIEFARSHGWLVLVVRPVPVARKDGSVYWQTPFGADGVGWPDTLFVRDRIVVAELKVKKSLSPEQRRWRDALLKAGVAWFKWRPQDWGQIEEILK